MVLFYLAKRKEEYAIFYMGRDKFENEDLIKYAPGQDVWFHVDNYSSAHVYLHLESINASNSAFHGLYPELKQQNGDDKKYELGNVPEWLIKELSVFTKGNSIQASKLTTPITVVYTPTENLKKTKDMDTGTVGFKEEGKKKILRYLIASESPKLKRPSSAQKEAEEEAAETQKQLLKRLEKTKLEITIQQFQQLLKDYEKVQKQQKQVQYQKLRHEKLKEKHEYQKQKEASDYGTVFKEENMTSNVDILNKYMTEDGQVDATAFEEDFM